MRKELLPDFAKPYKTKGFDVKLFVGVISYLRFHLKEYLTNLTLYLFKAILELSLLIKGLLLKN